MNEGGIAAAKTRNAVLRGVILRPMNPNQIDSAKENIGFLTRTMLAYIAGGYLLAGALGNYLVGWFERGEFGTVAAIIIAGTVGLSLEVARLQRKIKNLIQKIGETP